MAQQQADAARLAEEQEQAQRDAEAAAQAAAEEEARRVAEAERLAAEEEARRIRKASALAEQEATLRRELGMLLVYISACLTVYLSLTCLQHFLLLFSTPFRPSMD